MKTLNEWIATTLALTAVIALVSIAQSLAVIASPAL